MRVSFLVPAVVALLPPVAVAELEFCNESHTTVHIAIGYSENDTWISQGWWLADAGDCVVAVEGDLRQRYYYYYADATDQDYTFDDSDTVYSFCIQAPAFTIYGDTDCEGRGYSTEDFNELDTGDSLGFTLTLH